MGGGQINSHLPWRLRNRRAPPAAQEGEAKGAELQMHCKHAFEKIMSEFCSTAQS